MKKLISILSLVIVMTAACKKEEMEPMLIKPKNLGYPVPVEQFKVVQMMVVSPAIQRKWEQGMTLKPKP